MAITILNSATLATGSGFGENASSVDLSALTADTVVIEATITTTSDSPGEGKYVYVFYAFSSVLVTSDIPAAMRAPAEVMKLLLPIDANAVQVYATDILTKTGPYLYIWTCQEDLRAPVTLNVTLAQITISAGGGGGGGGGTLSIGSFTTAGSIPAEQFGVLADGSIWVGGVPPRIVTSNDVQYTSPASPGNPKDVNSPAVAYDTNGTGSTYYWVVATQAWR